MDSRENMHPLWADLSARADAARQAYRESAGDIDSRLAFGRALRRLGFDDGGIVHELRENNPNPQYGPGSN